MSEVDGFAAGRSGPSDLLTVSLQIAQTSITAGRDSRLMRPAVLALAVAGLLAVPAAHATVLARTQGSVSLELQDGAGVAKIRFRGNFLGRIVRGRIVATSNVILSGCDYRRRLADGRILCRGRDLTFRTPPDARWRLLLGGHGINAAGFVRGCIVLDGVDIGPTGTFRRDGSMWRSWPRQATLYQLGLGC